MRLRWLGPAASVVAATAALVPPAAADTAQSQGVLRVAIGDHAHLTADGGLIFPVRIRCGGLPGSEDFREAFAGAFQQRTGAEGEGGIGPDITCDGVRRVHTASVSSISDQRFRRGEATASANVIACNVVGDGQVCLQASDTHTVVVHRSPGR